MIEVPSGSIYIWMYVMGLKHVPLEELEHAIRQAGKSIRPKDEQNYWNGWYRSDLYLGDGRNDVIQLRPPRRPPSNLFLVTPWDEYPPHPYRGLPEIDQRWVPINQLVKPMIKWSEGCMFKDKAEDYFGCVSLAENLKGTQMIVVDVDGDHEDGRLLMETIDHMWKYSNITHTLSKRKMICEYNGYESTADFRPASFHLTFKVDRLVPTMHFPEVGLDIIGNRVNSLRYLKDKVWNGLEPLTMTPTIWTDLQEFIREHK